MIKKFVQKDPFPIDMENARNLPMQQLADTFIPTRLFWELLSVGHRILLGARGQGKTALFRMLAFEGLSALSRTNNRVKQIVDADKFIGIYLPTKLEWVQSLSLQTGDKSVEASKAFLWKLNHSSCVAFLQTASAYVSYHYKASTDAIMLEQRFCKELSEVWKLMKVEFTIDGVMRQLKRVGYEWQIWTSSLLMGDVKRKSKCSSVYEDAFRVFALEELKPLQVGIELFTEIMSISREANWLLCIDEAEYMTKSQQQVLNSLMRLTPGKLFLKVATMPYGHYTLETDNPAAPVTPGHDFEYLHMENGWAVLSETGEDKNVEDENPETQEFGELLFAKVANRYLGERASQYRLKDLFGDCELLDPQKTLDWTRSSHNMKLLQQYASNELITRAKKIQCDKDKEKFMNEIGRKIRGALLLRAEAKRTKGHRKSGIFSGASMIIRCADGNPRMLIRILNKFFAGGLVRLKGTIGRHLQEDVLTALAKNFLNQIRSYQNVGLKLYENVKIAGNYMAYELYQRPLTSDCVFSIKVAEPTSEDCQRAELIKSAIKYGVLKPNDASKINYGAEATLAGKYHLSYIFCPLFRIQPRFGKAISFETMKKRVKPKGDESKRKVEKNWTQMTFDFTDTGV